MTRYLLFTLAAPMASFGTVAVGERRPTWDRPSKSQIIGLVAGSLGIERSNEVEQGKLASGLGFAVRIDDPGRLASDYHTAERPEQSRANKEWTRSHGPIRTRADELSRPDRKAILSQREFRTGSHYTICLWRHENAECRSLEDIAEKLRAPIFAPFAGSKAHPLTFPLLPSAKKHSDPIIDAANVTDAFAKFDRGLDQDVTALWHQLGVKLRALRPIYTDASAVPPEERDAKVAQLIERRDVPESRAKWRFGVRTEALLRTAPTEGDAS